MPTSSALGCAQCPPTRMLSASTMTAPRQERNGSRSGWRFRPGIALISLLAAVGWVNLAAQACLPQPAAAATTERLGVTPYSGLAIDGFDPVAYFFDSRPKLGLPDSQASGAGPGRRSRPAGGSPQAMNAGRINPPGPLPNRRAAPFPSVILRRAAVTPAHPAATSHSDVGARRG